MSKTIIDRLYEEHKLLVSFLTEAKEPSYANDVDAGFRKTLLLSSASFFEKRVQECLTEFFLERSKGDEIVVSFLKNKAIERQYHTYFDWKQRKGNQFFGMFGNGFKEFMIAEVKKDASLDLSIQSFIELGELRNLLVHQDYAAFPLDKTVDEIFSLYGRAKVFVDDLPSKLRLYTVTTPSTKVS